MLLFLLLLFLLLSAAAAVLLHYLFEYVAAEVLLQARISRATLDSWFNMGNVQALRETVQDFLEGKLASQIAS